MSKKIKRVFIANRGEIVKRIASSAHLLDIETVCVTTFPPPNYLLDSIDHFVFVAEETIGLFLDQKQLIRYAKESHCDSIHPGYGFLSENYQFAKLTAEAGLTWIGPPVKAMELMANKSTARTLAKKVKVPCINALQDFSSDSKKDQTKLKDFIKENPLPFLVKAALGGGGKGMRLIKNLDKLDDQITAASREAQKAFSDGSLIVEQFIENARHIEVQVLGDQAGNLIVLGDRDCSVQRRHQKIIEEAPAIGLSDETRSKLHQAAKDLAQSVGYYSSGTVEFIFPWTKETKNNKHQPFYFLEMNTRLQVEHAITEEIFSIDLVAWQFRIAGGEKLSPHLKDLKPQGHSIEARIYAEDPKEHFLPSPGEICGFEPSNGPGVRWELGIDPIDQVSNLFDPMIAKVVATGGDRQSALKKLKNTLEKTFIGAPPNNIELLISILSQKTFCTEAVSTHYLDHYLPDLLKKIAIGKESFQKKADELFAIIKGLNSNTRAPAVITPEKITQHAYQKDFKDIQRAPSQEEWTVVQESYERNYRYPRRELSYKKLSLAKSKNTSNIMYSSTQSQGTTKIYLCLAGYQYTKTLEKKQWQHQNKQTTSKKELTAPVPGKIVRVLIRSGDSIEAQQSCFILESMKMEFEIKSSYSTKIKHVIVKEGEQVEAGKILAIFQ